MAELLVVEAVLCVLGDGFLPYFPSVYIYIFEIFPENNDTVCLVKSEWPCPVGAVFFPKVSAGRERGDPWTSCGEESS